MVNHKSAATADFKQFPRVTTKEVRAALCIKEDADVIPAYKEFVSLVKALNAWCQKYQMPNRVVIQSPQSGQKLKFQDITVPNIIELASGGSVGSLSKHSHDPHALLSSTALALEGAFTTNISSPKEEEKKEEAKKN